MYVNCQQKIWIQTKAERKKKHRFCFKCLEVKFSCFVTLYTIFEWSVWLPVKGFVFGLKTLRLNELHMYVCLTNELTWLSYIMLTYWTLHWKFPWTITNCLRYTTWREILKGQPTTIIYYLKSNRCRELIRW